MHQIHGETQQQGGAGAGCANTELTAIIISELRETYGIKYRKEKKQKTLQVMRVISNILRSRMYMKMWGVFIALRTN